MLPPDRSPSETAFKPKSLTFTSRSNFPDLDENETETYSPPSTPSTTAIPAISLSSTHGALAALHREFIANRDRAAASSSLSSSGSGSNFDRITIPIPSLKPLLGELRGAIVAFAGDSDSDSDSESESERDGDGDGDEELDLRALSSYRHGGAIRPVTYGSLEGILAARGVHGPWAVGEVDVDGESGKVRVVNLDVNVGSKGGGIGGAHHRRNEGNDASETDSDGVGAESWDAGLDGGFVLVEEGDCDEDEEGWVVRNEGAEEVRGTGVAQVMGIGREKERRWLNRMLPRA